MCVQHEDWGGGGGGGGGKKKKGGDPPVEPMNFRSSGKHSYHSVKSLSFTSPVHTRISTYFRFNPDSNAPLEVG